MTANPVSALAEQSRQLMAALSSATSLLDSVAASPAEQALRDLQAAADRAAERVESCLGRMAGVFTGLSARLRGSLDATTDDLAAALAGRPPQAPALPPAPESPLPQAKAMLAAELQALTGTCSIDGHGDLRVVIDPPADAYDAHVLAFRAERAEAAEPFEPGASGKDALDTVVTATEEVVCKAANPPVKPTAESEPVKPAAAILAALDERLDSGATMGQATKGVQADAASPPEKAPPPRRKRGGK